MPQPVSQPGALPPARGGSGLKILFVVLGCLAVAGIAVIGGVYYVVHKVKQAVVEKAAENGVDLSSITSPVAHSNAPKPKIRKPCDYLSKDEVSRLIGEPVERAEVRDAACMYYGAPGLTEKLAQDQASSTFKRAQAPGAKVDGMDVANAVDQYANSLGAGQMTGGDAQTLLMLLVDADDGRAQMTAVTAANAIFGGIYKAAGETGTKMVASVPGLGDKAVRVPKLGLNVLQGETLIRVIPGPIPGADQKTVDVARAVLGRL
jgi:hypothetical protein